MLTKETWSVLHVNETVFDADSDCWSTLCNVGTKSRNNKPRYRIKTSSTRIPKADASSSTEFSFCSIQAHATYMREKLWQKLKCIFIVYFELADEDHGGSNVACVLPGIVKLEYVWPRMLEVTNLDRRPRVPLVSISKIKIYSSIVLTFTATVKPALCL